MDALCPTKIVRRWRGAADDSELPFYRIRKRGRMPEVEKEEDDGRGSV